MFFLEQYQAIHRRGSPFRQNQNRSGYHMDNPDVGFELVFLSAMIERLEISTIPCNHLSFSDGFCATIPLCALLSASCPIASEASSAR